MTSSQVQSATMECNALNRLQNLLAMLQLFSGCWQVMAAIISTVKLKMHDALSRSIKKLLPHWLIPAPHWTILSDPDIRKGLLLKVFLYVITRLPFWVTTLKSAVGLNYVTLILLISVRICLQCKSQKASVSSRSLTCASHRLPRNNRTSIESICSTPKITSWRKSCAPCRIAIRR